MKKTKMTLLSLVAMVCMIGTAFAAWTFGDAKDTGASTNATITVEGATDYGTVAISSESCGIEIDNNAVTGTASFKVDYKISAQATAPADNMQLVVTLGNEWDAYLTFVAEAADTNWTSEEGVAYANKNTTVTITPTWIGSITDVAAWETLKTLASTPLSITVKVVPVEG